MAAAGWQREAAHAIVQDVVQIWNGGTILAADGETAFRTWPLPTEQQTLDSKTCLSLSMPRLPLKTFEQRFGRRLLFWPNGVHGHRRLAILSSRLKKRKDLQRWWFDAVRTVVLRSDPNSDCLCVVDGTASEAAVSRASELFGIWRLRLRVPAQTVTSPDDLTAWLMETLSRADQGGSSDDFETHVWFSPALIADGDSSMEATAQICGGRDDALVGVAEKVVSLYCRPNGTVQRLLTDCRRDESRIDQVMVAVTTNDAPPIPAVVLESGVVPWILDERNRSDRPANPTTPETESAFTEATESGPLRSPADWLCHWTRPAYGPWPDQSGDEYLDELILGCDSADRSAIACLLRIAARGQLLATVATRGEVPTVSLTAVPLKDFRRRRVFRQHRQRYDFEPWGVAVRKTAVIQQGGRPVRYLDAGSDIDLAAGDFTQSRFDAHGRIDWSEEQEWRIPGDVDLTVFSPADVCFFVNSCSEVPTVRAATSCSVIVVPDSGMLMNCKS